VKTSTFSDAVVNQMRVRKPNYPQRQINISRDERGIRYGVLRTEYLQTSSTSHIRLLVPNSQLAAMAGKSKNTEKTTRSGDKHITKDKGSKNSTENKAREANSSKLKPATAINARHILVCCSISPLIFRCYYAVATWSDPY
jgi:hypothetical protein